MGNRYLQQQYSPVLIGQAHVAPIYSNSVLTVYPKLKLHRKVKPDTVEPEAPVAPVAPIAPVAPEATTLL